MADAAQSNSVQLAVNVGHQQIGQEMFVTLMINVGTMTTTLALPVDAAKHMSRLIKDGAETAEVQIIKPPSLLAAN